VQYAALALAGYFPTAELQRVKSLGGHSTDIDFASWHSPALCAP
jgi:hypothetical protein